MKKSIIIIIAVVSLFMTRCALHGGYTTNSAALSTNNFTYVEKSVQGTAEATYIFGIGGLKREALVEEARKDLLENTHLKDNQTFVNITVSFKTIFVLPFFMRNKCTVSASVVQFNSAGQKSTSDQESNSAEKRSAAVPENNVVEKKIQITEEEMRIDSARGRHLALTKYNALSEIMVGDMVAFNTAYGETVYGIVHRIKKQFVEIKTFPSPGNILYQETHWKELKKIER